MVIEKEPQAIHIGFRAGPDSATVAVNVHSKSDSPAGDGLEFDTQRRGSVGELPLCTFTKGTETRNGVQDIFVCHLKPAASVEPHDFFVNPARSVSLQPE